MNHLPKGLAALLLGALLFPLAARTQPASGSEPVRPPEGRIERRLDNGLSYVLQPNDSPTRKIECRLIFRAGSVLEEEHDRGAAHFLEHMAFGGTRRFPRRTLVEYLESLGAQYGFGINAYTGYDRTIYMFSIPSDESRNLDRALLILREWLTAITLDPRKVEGEKGIILEELRGYDVGDDFYALKIGGGRYGRGIPLGTAEQIGRITPEVLRSFHSRWYTLGQATVALVGDIDPADAERRIRRTFGGLQATSSPDFRNHPLEYAPGTTYAEAADPQRRGASLEVMVPHRATLRRTLDDAVACERNALLVRALSDRFYDLGCRASISNHWYLADTEHFVVSVDGAGPEELRERLTQAVTQLHRVAREGFPEAEMERLRTRALARFRLPVGSRNSEAVCDDIADAVLVGDRAVSDPEQFAWVRNELAATSSEQLQELLRQWLTAADSCRLVACRYNPEQGGGLSAEAVDRAWRQGAEAPAEAPYRFTPEEPEPEAPRTEVPAFLDEARPFDPTQIVARRHYPACGVTEVELANGFRFLLRPTRGGEQQIQMQLLAPGGLSRIPVAEYPLYEGVAGYMELGGIERLDDETYNALIAEHGLGVLVAMEPYWHGIIASGPVASQRLLFNLVLERMVRPRLNYADFEELRREELASCGEESHLSMLMRGDMQRQLSMRLDSLMGNILPARRSGLTREELRALDLDRIGAFYRTLYAEPRGMTCVVCGDFDPDDLLREAVPLFGSLTPGAEPNRMGPSHFRQPDENLRLAWPNANPSQTVFDRIQFGHYEPSLRSGLMLKLIRGVIRSRLIGVLRERESLAYSPYVDLSYTARPDSIFYFDINASVECAHAARANALVDDILRELRRRPISDRELRTLQRIFIMNKRDYLEEDATANWKGHLVNMIRNGESVADFERYESVLEGITPRDLRAAIRRFLDPERYLVLSLGPFDEPQR